MVKVKSLDHTRFVITGTGVSKNRRTLYYSGANGMANMGDWSFDLGGAKAYNNLHEAEKKMEYLRNYHNKVLTNLGSNVDFKVELVQRKDIMIARLKYNGEKT